MESNEIAVDFILFETERLYLREFNMDDADAVYAYAGDAENTVYMDWGPESMDGVISFVKSRLAHQINTPRCVYDFAICLKRTGEFIGAMGLYLDDNRQQAMLGYILNKAFWGSGYAVEAAKGFLKFGFMSLDLHRIWAKCDSENLSSEAVMRRIGMRKEGEMKYARYTRVRAREQWRSEKYYAILQRDYLNALYEAGQNSSDGAEH